jgi:hypothetical protein
VDDVGLAVRHINGCPDRPIINTDLREAAANMSDIAERIDNIKKILAEVDVLAERVRGQRRWDIKSKITAARIELDKLRSRFD